MRVSLSLSILLPLHLRYPIRKSSEQYANLIVLQLYPTARIEVTTPHISYQEGLNRARYFQFTKKNTRAS